MYTSKVFRPNYLLFFYTVSFFFLLFLCSKRLTAQDFSQGIIVKEFPEADYVYGLSSSPDDALIAMALAHKRILILDADFEPVLEYPMNPFYGGSVGEFSANGKYFSFYKYAEMDTLFLYDIKQQALEEAYFNHLYGTHFLDPSDNLLLLGRNKVFFYNPQTQERAIVVESSRIIDDVQLSRDRKIMAVSYPFDPIVDIYDAESFTKITRIPIQSKQPLDLCLNDSLLVFKKTNILKVFNFNNNSLEAIFSLPYPRITNLLLTEKGIYMTGGDSELAFYHFASKKLEYLPVNIKGISKDIYQLHNGDILMIIDKKLVYFKME